MDNGHQKAIFSENPDMENSLNEDNWQRSLEISAPVDLPSPEEAASIKSEPKNQPAPENQPSLETQNTSEPTNPYELGQIISATPENQNPLSSSGAPQDNFAPIRIDGDRMNKSGIEKIDRAIEKLNQDQSLSSFYDEIRGPIAKEAQDAVGHINTDNIGEAA